MPRPCRASLSRIFNSCASAKRSAVTALESTPLSCRKHGVLSSTEMNVSLHVWNHQKLELVRNWMKWSQVSMLRNCNTSIPRIFGILDTCQVVSHTVKDTENQSDHFRWRISPISWGDSTQLHASRICCPRLCSSFESGFTFRSDIWSHSSEVQMMQCI